MLYRPSVMPASDPATAEAPTYGTPGAMGKTYSVNDLQSWYQGQFGSAIDPTLLQQIGAAVGPAGAKGGNYTQAQWDTAMGMIPGSGQPGTNGNTAGFFPEFQAPTYESGPAYEAPKPFQAPTMDEALNDPGYQFALQQGQNAIMSNAAARGLAKTGGTLKNLVDYGQQAATQQYGKVYDRAAGQYAQNYQMGRDAWQLNAQERAARNEWNYRGGSDAFNAKFRGREMQFEDLYRRWRDKANIEAQMALAD